MDAMVVGVAVAEMAGGESRATVESVAGGRLLVMGGETCDGAEHETGGEEAGGCFMFEQ